MHLGQRNIGQLALCGWPGLAPLWLRGSWSSLAIAIGFSVLLNVALITTFVWPTLLGETFPVVAWSVIALIWISSVVISYRMMEEWSGPPVMAAAAKLTEIEDFLPENDCHTLFNRAQSEYLKGNWLDAEALLKRQLKIDERDMESRLLLATLFRHTKQLDLAENELETLQRFDASVHWKFEINSEQKLIRQIKTEVRDENQTQTLASAGSKPVRTTSAETHEA